MPLAVASVEESDWERIAAIGFLAFHDEPFWHVLYPGGDTPAAREAATKRFVAGSKNNPEEFNIKCYDDTTGDILAYAAWCNYKEDPFARDAEGEGVNARIEATWSKGVEREYAEFVLCALRDSRKSFKQGRRAHLYLKLLFTDPRVQKRGAGSMLVKWGTDQADATGVPCIVEASAHAYEARFYHKHGFSDVRRSWVENRDRFPGTVPVVSDVMYRLSKGEDWKKPPYEQIVISKSSQTA